MRWGRSKPQQPFVSSEVEKRGSGAARFSTRSKRTEVVWLPATRFPFVTRCFIQGGGCSGFQYGFTLDQQKEDDWVFETNGAKLLIDPLSGVYFKDATIDYVNDPLQGSMFTINNPNAKSTCGCGSSAAF